MLYRHLDEQNGMTVAAESSSALVGAFLRLLLSQKCIPNYFTGAPTGHRYRGAGSGYYLTQT